MKILVESVINPSKPFDTESSDPVGQGGEAEIFKIPASCLINSNAEGPLVKIYDQTKISGEKLVARQDKGMLLVNKYTSFSSSFEQSSKLDASMFAFPQNNAVDYDKKSYAGFSMRDLGRWSTLEDFVFQDGKITNIMNDYVMTDDEAVELFYNLTYGVFLLHKRQIILGDLNERNILYDTDRKLPLLLDIDSAQVEGFVCDTSTAEVLDPLVTRKRLDGSENQSGGSYEYSSGSDIFALATNIYKLMTGYFPADFLAQNKPGDIQGLTRKKMFLIRLKHDKNFLQNSGLELLNNDEHEKRLVEIQKKFPALYQHFVEVFVNDQRSYFTETLPTSDFRHPDFHDYHESTADSNYEDYVEPVAQKTSLPKGRLNLKKILFELKLNYTDNMNDSAAFKKFVNSLGYDYAGILSGVI